MQSRPPLLFLGAVVPILFALSGCDGTRSYTVQIDAIAAPTETGQPAPSGQSYHIRTHNPRLDEDSLRYREVTDYVRTALSGRGMYEAPSPEQADVVIDIDYGIDAPRIKYELMSNPVVVEVAGNVREEIIPIRDNNGNVMGYRTIVLQEPARHEFMGMDESIRPVVIYEKFLKLSARANQPTTEGRAPPEVWSVNVSTEDSSQELRRYMPVLASATADYIGANTKAEKPVRISEGSDGVAFVKQGM
jgi:hypothetical protein